MGQARLKSCKVEMMILLDFLDNKETFINIGC